jgi:hypothetical protein
VTGGSNLIVQLAAASTLTSSVTVALSSDHPALVPVPATVSLFPSKVPQALTVHTAATTTPVTVTLTATAGSQTVTTTVTVVP